MKKWGTPYRRVPVPLYTHVTMIMKIIVICSLYATMEYIPEYELAIWRPERRIQDARVVSGVLCHRTGVCGRRLRLQRQLVLATQQRGRFARRYHSFSKRHDSIPSQQELRHRFVYRRVWPCVCPCVCLSLMHKLIGVTGGGDGSPRVTPFRGDTRMNFFYNVALFRKNSGQ